MQTAPRILALSTLTDDAAASDQLPAIAALGFTMVALFDPAAAENRGGLARLAEAAKAAGLRVMVALPPDASTALDRVHEDLAIGVDGFLAVSADRLASAEWRHVIGAARAIAPQAVFAAETLGGDANRAQSLRGAGFDLLLNSVRWWDGREPWFLDQQAATRPVAGSLGFPDLPGMPADPTDTDRIRRRRLMMAATLSTGWLVPATWLGHDDAMIAEINRLKALLPSLNEEGPMTRLDSGTPSVTAILRETGIRDDGLLILINTDGSAPQPVDFDALLGAIERDGIESHDVTPGASPTTLPPSPLLLDAGEIRLVRIAYEHERLFGPAELPAAPDRPSRIIIERVTPELDGGRLPVKRVVGETLEVSADIFRDGHDKIAAALWLRSQDSGAWRIAPMHHVDNDRWAGRITLDRIGDARFAVGAWTDHFASWRDEVAKKRAAGRAIGLELIEGRELLAAAIERAEGEDASRLRDIKDHALTLDEPVRAEFMLSNRVALAMARVPDHGDLTFQEPVGRVMVDREGARFAAWYEMFPRSQGTDPTKAASFADCAARLPEIRELGFDVVYLVPIHPIGMVNRKGRNNSTTAAPGEPGSPYAIGSTAGGHDAIDPDIGTIDEFRGFVRAVHDHGMEVAMDFAVQCAPDHPWLTEHPGWFKRRPDGTIKFAENPPKRYEDIVNVDFDQPDWKGLWEALRDVIRFWVDEGVKIFRVDNPHTKPVAFWEWLIADIRSTAPDVLFLAEAFTRPKMMRRLAKIGFSQSYSYFTWRNDKREIIDYLTELTVGESAQYYRPNFFPTTPDILPSYLQTSGRAGFVIRLVLAATLSPVYGLYNGYELCEAEPVPGKEEFLNSEKYQYKVWDWDRPGNIKDEIARINRLRHDSPALRLFDNLRFHEATHDDVLFYSKMTADRTEQVFVAVTLDPKRVARSEIVFPMDAMGLPWDGSFETEDLFTGERRRWTGARHAILLDPETYPAMILRIRPVGAES
ncbi:MAG TPA: alpha-1,4-glucan--maltose-1-phosphate maltosyltransferase [Aliidongia sp.]|uniref:alpha-1,4-glucan--maltose-1-phosphate maltosyltransferase n=1 Tax=Aliidongia sp. TaxID=1914230 RepID=UPI002DDCB956|nr:alpha-1,4-glucan--maltose-1-phosphate maltosyltransferase [Aliidongia sp.]HEV2675626.1 alpha-1,4-glucan--maltose-1-phosphate maltosyltransferase [Aliidongia sp.]